MFVTANKIAQLIVVLLCALTLKQFYSTANVNELRWILAPTTVLVELVSGSRFQFESYAGYMNSDHSFVIAASCAGVNFLLTGFLMLSLAKLWRDRWRKISWGFIPAAVMVAYLTTVVANSVRIVVALWIRKLSPEITWLDPDQLHRLEGIVVYFGFLLLLFVLSRRISYRNMRSVDPVVLVSTIHDPWFTASPVTGVLFPLFIYYATTVGIPLVTAAYRANPAPTDFWQHLLFVSLIPLILILPITAFRRYKTRRSSETEPTLEQPLSLDARS